MSKLNNTLGLPSSKTIQKAIDAQYQILNGMSDGPRFARKRDEIEERINTLSEKQAQASKFERSLRS